MENNKVKQELARIYGVKSLNNVELVDKPYSSLSDDKITAINKLVPYLNRPSMEVVASIAGVASAGLVLLMQEGITIADRAMLFRPEIASNQASLYGNIPVVGFLVSQRFSNNNMTSSYNLEVRVYSEFRHQHHYACRAGAVFSYHPGYPSSRGQLSIRIHRIDGRHRDTYRAS